MPQPPGRQPATDAAVALRPRRDPLDPLGDRTTTGHRDDYAVRSVQEAIAAAAAVLSEAGVDAPRVDAELLAAEALGVPRSRLTTAQLDPAADARFTELVRQRAERRPLQHLTGSAPFRLREVAVGPGAF